MMKVVLVQPYGHLAGHYSTYTYQLSKALTELGHGVHIVSGRGFREAWWTSLPVVHEAVALRSPIQRLSQYLCDHKLRQRFETWHVQQRAFEIAMNTNSVLHFVDFDPVLLYILNFRWGRPRYVLTLPSADYSFKHCRGGLLRKFRKGIEGRCIADLTRNAIVVVHAEHVMMLAEQRNLLFSSDQVYLIPWGMEVKAGDKDGERKLARDKLGIPRDSRVALFFGFLRPGKGLDYLIDAVSQLERGCLHVVVAGELDPSLGFDPADIASERGCLSDFDFYTYYIPKERMDLLFNAADFVVLPYSKTLHGDSGVLAHACEYGLPVVASNVGELGKRVKDHNLGLLCEPDSVESLTSVLKRFLSLSRAELSQMRENVLSYASSRSWKWVAQKHAEIYHLAASSRGSCSTLS